jgi:hypothetical protein
VPDASVLSLIQTRAAVEDLRSRSALVTRAAGLRALVGGTSYVADRFVCPTVAIPHRISHLGRFDVEGRNHDDSEFSRRIDART